MTQIVDTAGMDEYSKLSRNASLGVHGYIMVFSVTSKLSLEKIRNINEMLIKLLGNTSDIPRVLVGTMCDVDSEYTISENDFDPDGMRSKHNSSKYNMSKNSHNPTSHNTTSHNNNNNNKNINSSNNVTHNNINNGNNHHNNSGSKTASTTSTATTNTTTTTTKHNNNNNNNSNNNMNNPNSIHHQSHHSNKRSSTTTTGTGNLTNDNSHRNNNDGTHLNNDKNALDTSTNSVASNISNTSRVTSSNLLFGPGATSKNNNLRITANGIDKQQREVSTEEGQYIADSWGVPYIEVSAKFDLNVNSVFETLIKEIEKDSTLIERENVPSCILL